MQLKQYTIKDIMDGKIKCYFCGASLKEYIENLPTDFMDYEIQRGIVNNIYLDRIVDTVLEKNHIPAITIVTSSLNQNVNKENTLVINEFKILDGLQRTFRLKILWNTVNFLEEVQKEIGEDIYKYTKLELSRKFGKDLKKLSSTTLVLERLIQSKKNIEEIKDCFNETQWFEVWEGLNPQQEVEKMLMLNAGHKQVSLKHQLELLFLNLTSYFEDIKKSYPNFILYREKEVSSISFSKGRKKWEFHFSHLITACLAFLEKDTITANASLIKEIQDEKLKNGEFIGLISYELLTGIVNFLMKLDNYLDEHYKFDEGIQWISRETVTIGLFAALGKYAEEKYENKEKILEKFVQDLSSSDQEFLNIREYNKARANIDLSKVNVGELTKKAVYLGVIDFLDNGTPINWSVFFRSVKNVSN